MVEVVHQPVLVNETLELLAPERPASSGEDTLMIDATLGEGGHAEAFLSTYKNLNLVGMDADLRIIERARERLIPFGDRVRIEHAWSNRFFSSYPKDLERPDIILLDLGISLFHYERSNRGFSFQKDETLDMRLDEGLETSAADILNQYPEKEIASVLKTYGEERYSRRIAESIVRERSERPIKTTQRLADIVKTAVPAEYRHGRIHPATRTFQALRIVVNGELARLEQGLELAIHRLEIGGRIGVISFHSLEDRIVKLMFRHMNKSCTCPPEWPVCKCGGTRVVEIITKRPVRPTEEEISRNAASRSAKLRVAKKLADKEV